MPRMESFYRNCAERLASAPDAAKADSFSVCCVEAGGYAAGEGVAADEFRQRLVPLAENEGIADAAAIFDRMFPAGQSVPRTLPELDERLVSVRRRGDSYVIFDVCCECDTPEHTITVIVDKWDKSSESTSATLYMKTYWHDETGEDNIFLRIIKRVKAALHILFSGCLEMEGEVIFRNKQHVRAFADTLNAAAEHVKNNIKCH